MASYAIAETEKLQQKFIDAEVEYMNKDYNKKDQKLMVNNTKK
ncbi:MAG: hypothetical protein ACI37S_01520 [Candidatus Gastranaerophilaceae bacterium]